MKKIQGLALLFTLLLLAGCSKHAVSPESVLDTPQTHIDQALRLMDRGQWEDARREIDRSLAMEEDFYLGWSVKGLWFASQKQGEEALRAAHKAVDIANNRWQAYTYLGRVQTMVQADEDWFKDAGKSFERAAEQDGAQTEVIQFWRAEAMLAHLDFAAANAEFAKVIAHRGDLAGKADERMALCSTILRAQPGTRVSSKIALEPAIDRADLAVLLVEELKLPEILNEHKPLAGHGGFQAPGQNPAAAAKQRTPADIEGHWASSWIRDIVEAGGMELMPDGGFAPEEKLTRASYAMLITNLLATISNDPGLTSKHFGEQSMFPDVPSSHPAYNAVAVCTSRGIMEADLRTGRFGLTETVSGAEALLIIRQFQSVLRRTF